MALAEVSLTKAELTYLMDFLKVEKNYYENTLGFIPADTRSSIDCKLLLDKADSLIEQFTEAIDHIDITEDRENGF